MITTVLFITLLSTATLAQGLLVESALKIFTGKNDRTEQSETLFTTAGYHSNEYDSGRNSFNSWVRSVMENVKTEASNTFRNNPVILNSFTVSGIDASYESELNAEEWMATPFTEEMETELAAEPWMTESFYEDLEAENAAEAWMAEPLSDDLELPVTTENWMETPLSADLEASLTVENWMTESFTKGIESPVETEDWMTVAFSNQVEQKIEVEDWMTEPMYRSISGQEDELSVEGWMTELLYK